GRGCLSCRSGRHCAPGRHDQGYTAVHQVGRQLRQPRKLTVRPTVLDRDLAAFDIAAFAQALAECIREPPERAGRGAVEKADRGHGGFWGFSGGGPPSRRAAEQRDELAPPNSITSSARKRIEVRTATPMVFVLERASSSCRQAAALFLIAPMIAVSMAPPAPPAIAWEMMPSTLRLPDCAAAVISRSNNVTR